MLRTREEEAYLAGLLLARSFSFLYETGLLKLLWQKWVPEMGSHPKDATIMSIGYSHGGPAAGHLSCTCQSAAGRGWSVAQTQLEPHLLFSDNTSCLCMVSIDNHSSKTWQDFNDKSKHKQSSFIIFFKIWTLKKDTQSVWKSLLQQHSGLQG